MRYIGPKGEVPSVGALSKRTQPLYKQRNPRFEESERIFGRRPKWKIKAHARDFVRTQQLPSTSFGAGLYYHRGQLDRGLELTAAGDPKLNKMIWKKKSWNCNFHKNFLKKQSLFWLTLQLYHNNIPLCSPFPSPPKKSIANIFVTRGSRKGAGPWVLNNLNRALLWRQNVFGQWWSKQIDLTIL